MLFEKSSVMIKMTNIVVKNESELEQLLKADIDSTQKDIRILAGHLPLLYDCSIRKVELGVDRWGEFSPYTFELGARLLRHALDSGKLGKLIVLVDDDVELPRIERNDTYVRRDIVWAKRPRRRLLNSSSLPQQYQEILDRYNLDSSHLVCQEKKGKTTVLISEKRLKREAVKRKIAAPNECSLAYKGLLSNEAYFNHNENYLISFIPGQCKGNICQGVLNVDTDLESSHVFFPHIEAMGGIYRAEHGYVRLPNATALTIQKMFERGLIKYHKN